MSPFRRSGTFGLVGVVVVAVVVAVIANTQGQGQANPKGAYALIFGIIAAYVVLLFVFQSRDLSRAEAGEAGAAPDDGRALANPATLGEPELSAAMAVNPIDRDAVRARRQVWSTTRASMRTGMVVCALIFLTVPPIYLLESFVPLLIGGPLIVGVALWRSVRLLASGGDLDRAYEQTGVAMAPLGLSVQERPQVSIEARTAVPLRYGPRIRGALVLAGARHGRPVTVRMPSSDGVRAKTEVLVGVPVPPFELRSRDGRVKAADGAPEAVREALRAIPGSVRWKGVRGHAGPDGIAIERTGTKTGDWLLDLWLAERLADTLAAMPSR